MNKFILILAIVVAIPFAPLAISESKFLFAFVSPSDLNKADVRLVQVAHQEKYWETAIYKDITVGTPRKHK